MKSITINSSMCKMFKYPAGEQQVRLDTNVIEVLKSSSGSSDINVVSTIKNSDDVITTAMLLSAVSGVIKNRTGRLRLILPYLPYGRADRRFVEGDCFGLDVFLELFSTLVEEIVTLDIHSNVGIELSKEDTFNKPTLINISPLELIVQAIQNFAVLNKSSKVTVLLPDEGAKNRYDIPSIIGNNHNLINVSINHCTKSRNPVSGKLTGFMIPKDIPEDTAILIVDDVCDGGGTFTGIASQLDNKYKLGLYVTHGIFS
jgi:ribose-phosphate pyrophosphokinase